MKQKACKVRSWIWNFPPGLAGMTTGKSGENRRVFMRCIIWSFFCNVSNEITTGRSCSIRSLRRRHLKGVANSIHSVCTLCVSRNVQNYSNEVNGSESRRIKRPERHDERNPDKLTNDAEMIGDVTNEMESECAFDSVTGCVRIVVAQCDTKNSDSQAMKELTKAGRKSSRLRQQPWHLCDAETHPVRLDNNGLCKVLPNFIRK